MELRTSPIRFAIDSVGLVAADNPHRFVERTASRGEAGRLIVEGDLPFSVPEGWVLVELDDAELGTLYAPVHPSMVEAA